MNAELILRSPFSSAMPSMWALGDVLLHHGADVQATPRAFGAAQIHQVWEDPGASVFVTTGTAVPDPDWACVTTAAEPSRKALIATLWNRLIQSVRIVANDNGSTPVSTESLGLVRELLSEFPLGLELPQISVSQDGELILTWFRNRDCLSATLENDQYLTWVSRRGSSIEDGDVIAFDEALGRYHFYEAVAQFYE